MPIQRSNIEPYYVPAQPPAAQPQRMEARPTFEGQSGAGRLLLFALFAIVAAAAAHFLGDMERLRAILLGMAFLIIMWTVDLVFATGFVHKWMEQRTESKRIDAAMIDAAAINEAQDEAMELLWQELQRIEQRLDAIETIRISDGRTTRDVHKADTVDLRIRQWITTDIFNASGAMIGVHPNSQLKRSVPFKESSPQDSDEYTAWRRLVAAGLLGRNGNNYIWTGPATLPLALEKLARLGAQNRS